MDRTFIELLYEQGQATLGLIVDKRSAEAFVENLFRLLFRRESRKYASKAELVHQYEGLRGSFSSILFDIIPGKEAVERIETAFFNALPGLYALLLDDARAILQNDPAAASLEEVLTAYPGFFAIGIYRFAHQLHVYGVPLLPRFLAEYAHSKTGIDIHPGARIGTSFFIDHGTGIVIGETTIIGDEVKIYQGVTIGALHVSKEQARVKRHPTIGDRVIIYSGATILGGETVVGHDSVIGGNVWLTQSVPPQSVVYHKSEVIVRGKQPLPEPVNFVI
ncbi:serine O-acetyltransferase [Taibaiella koreensis]|uniref:serine O-acetyltransferase n=1 Tax=Taibaiella koreensis TaxID=1268548 RepID=UPI000E599E19|nr:serine O-acetyltransferase [Taibaiella koreensis]